eukprot:TRINITY_DN7337_c0_g1_i1.p1 TRINITY_DN7337_c0_g1~~TRINITY_DN7337_c0_g1_i1.p1  ORF type:complete len:410 (-),score=36.15 TRINITY_DN7337_c0_g1_i1:115-1296(-)
MGCGVTRDASSSNASSGKIADAPCDIKPDAAVDARDVEVTLVMANGEVVLSRVFDVSVTKGRELRIAAAEEMDLSLSSIGIFQGTCEMSNQADQNLKLRDEVVVAAEIPAETMNVTFVVVVASHYLGSGLSGKVTYPYSPGGWNWGVSVAPCGTYLFVGNNFPHCGTHEPIHRIDLQSGDISSACKWTGKNPIGVAIAPCGTYALTTNTDGGSLARIDIPSGSVAYTCSGLRHPTGVAISPSGKYALADTEGKEVVKIDLAQSTIVQRFKGFACDHTGFAFAPDESFALVANTGRGEISSIDLVSGVVTLSKYKGFRRVKGVAISPSGRFALVSDLDGERIGHIDLGTGSVTFPYGSCPNPFSVTFSPDGKCAFFSCGRNCAGLWKIGRIDFK